MCKLLATLGIFTSFLRLRVIVPNFYMAYDTYGNTETKDIAYQSKRTRSSSTIGVQLVTHQISLTKLLCSKQKLNLMCNINYPKFPSCRICAKNVHDKDKDLQYDLCELWIHINCNKLNYLDYRYLQKCDESWYCIDSCSSIFPFNSLSSNKNLACCTLIHGW